MSKIKLMDRPGLTAVANVVWLALFSFLAHRRGPADWMGLGWALLALDSGRTVARAVAQIIGERWAEWDAKKIEGSTRGSFMRWRSVGCAGRVYPWAAGLWTR